MLAFSLAIALSISGLQIQNPETLLRRSDIGMFAPESFRATLTIIDPKKKVHRIEVWRSGGAKTLIRFLDKADRGKFLIRRDDQLWLITPGARRPTRVGSSYRLYGGATLDEVLGLKMADKYKIESVDVDGEGADETVTFEMRARTRDLLFQRVRYVVSRTRSLPVSAVYYVRSGRASTAVEFLDWNERGAPYARKVAVRDLLRNGARTEVTVDAMEPRVVDDLLFDLNDSSARRALNVRKD